MTRKPRTLTWIVAGVVALLGAVGAQAQEYPSRPITMVVPWPPGGTVDNNARVVARVLSEKLKQPIVIDNKAGAGGIVGAEYLANAKPDGYTIMPVTAGTMALYKYIMKLSFDPEKDFVPIYGFGVSYAMLVVRKDSPFKSVKDVIEAARKNPEKLNYATLGPGSAQHMSGTLFEQATGIRLMPIPYKGAAPALTDTLSGVLDVAFDYYSILRPHIESGALRPLGVSGPARFPAFADVPTYDELGYPNTTYASWSAFIAPTGTPDPIIKKLAAAIEETLRDERVVQYFKEVNSELLMFGGPKLDSYIADQRKLIKKLVEDVGITAN